MAKTVSVGCKLPNGIILEHPLDPAITVELAGLNNTTIIGSTFATTEVDADFWGAWEAANKQFEPFLSGAIFASKNSNELNAIAKEFSGRDTGLEPMKKKNDKRASGIAPATTKAEE